MIQIVSEDFCFQEVTVGKAVRAVLSGGLVEVYVSAVKVENPDIGLIFHNGKYLFYGLENEKVAELWREHGGEELSGEVLAKLITRSEEIVSEVFNLPE